MSTYLNAPDNDWYKERLAGAVFVIMAAFSLLLIRLFYLQIIEGEEYRRLSESNCIRIQSIDPPRGLIFDSRGELIVDNRPSFDVSIIPRDAKPVEETLNRLAGYMGMSQEEMLERLEKQKKSVPYKPVLLKQDVGRDILAAIEVHKFDLPGVVINVKPFRHYINKGSAAHVLGYLGEINLNELKSGKYPGTEGGDFIGKYGIEREFEDMLHGTRGGRQVEVDATGRVIRVLKTVDVKPGTNIYLTLDEELQKVAEKQLVDKVGAVVAMDPTNGNILAMASSPTFDQNDFVTGLSYKKWDELINNPDRPMENKAVQAVYPPASTYKIVTAIAGLEEGVIDETLTFTCNGYHRYGNRVYRCWKNGGHGTVDIYKAISESCDVYFYQVGQKLGVDKIAFYATASGLGSRTGISLDNESSGLVPTSSWKKKKMNKPWHGGETLSVAIGQGYNLATPLQMVTFMAAVANGGTRYKPQLLKQIESADGQIIEKNHAEIVGRLPVSKQYLDMVKKGLWETVQDNHGTAHGIRLKQIDISGKTGTAQVISKRQSDSDIEDGPEHHKPHAWFVAYAPSEAPRIAVSVMVEHGEHGSSTAAPIARDLIKQYLERNPD
ncbi:MAG: penicillin-binding protein 2 [Proteobacteria bacterium]|nr:penicillin-binding protein 2 [Pseudomonadota bacterium]